MARPYERILLVKYRGVGDSVMGLSTLQYLRDSYPHAYLVYGIRDWVAPLFSKVKTPADSILAMNLAKPKGWGDLLWELKKQRFDLVFELFQSGRTRKLFKTFAPWLGYDYRFHNQHLNTPTGVLDQGIIKPAIQRDLDGVFSFAGKGEVPPAYERYPAQLQGVQKRVGNFLVLGVVATRATKSWPVGYFATLARLIAKAYPDLEILVPLSDNARDSKREAELKNETLPPQLRFVRVPLADLPSLLSGARVYVGNDTGLKHIAAAVGVRTITLFGPESPLEWHPYDSVVHPYFYRDGLACRTERKHYCDLSDCNSMVCLNEFRPEGVFPVVERVLESRA